MRHSRLPSLVACLVTLLATVFSSLLVASPAHAGDDPDVGRPKVGSCHELTLEQAGFRTDPRDPVECGSRHTTLTTGVRTKPKNLDWDSGALESFTAAVCQKELISYFGEGSAEKLARSAYQLLFFYPTQAQRNRGATWLRCDLALRADVTLLPLGRFPKPGPASSLCLAPRSKSYAHTVCSRPHSFRAKATVQSKQRLYPSKKAWGKLSARCPSQARYYIYPSKPLYKAGSVYLTCLAKTSR